jgi:endonuclease III
MQTFTDKMKRLERVRLHLRRRYGDPPRVTVTHPVENALRAILNEEAAGAQVDEAMERLHQHFVDLNDLRVSRPREIRDVLGTDFPRGGHKARVIPRLLDQVFHQHNSMVWDFLEAMGKVETRTYFEKLEEVRPFVAAVLARDCVGAHAFPVDNDVARVLGRLGIVDPAKESEAKMQDLLERGVKANRAYEVHGLVKRLAEDLCVVGTPVCARCPLGAMCPSAVLPPKGRRRKAAAKAKAAAKPARAPKAAAKKKPKAASRKR